MGKRRQPNPAEQVMQQAQTRYQQTLQPSQAETEFGGVTNQFQENYNQAANQARQDYGNIMGGYQNFMQNLGSPTRFTAQNVTAERPAELGESYGYLREAMPGYREFSQTGGYSPQDIRELRARGISPIRAAYGNTMMQLDRARALGGAGGAPNYIAALSRAQRELPEQLAGATTDVNARLADAIRQGRMFGLQGISGTGATMGGLSSQEAGRMLQAALANQQADLQAQGMGEQSLQNLRQMQLAGLSGQAGLYGTTPGMANMFGNQALNAWQQRMGMEGMRGQEGLDLLRMQLQAGQQMPQRTPWWQTALGVAGTIAPFFSSKELKTDIKQVKGKEVSKFAKHLRNLPLYTWKYKDDPEGTRHFGPIAEEFKKKLGIGDGKTIHPADMFGIAIAGMKLDMKGGMNHA